MRQCLYAVYQAVKNEGTREGLNWLKTELPDYWGNREKIIQILEYLGRLKNISMMAHWRKEAEAARLLAGAVRNDHM